jgi:hypothetical protein
MEEDATVLFLCGVGRVASRLLSKLEGLDHSVTGGKVSERPTIAYD